MWLAVMEAVEQATNLSVKSGGLPTPKKKLPFKEHRGMTGSRHGRARRRGMRKRTEDGGAAMRWPKM
jgi:hypothetical protein